MSTRKIILYEKYFDFAEDLTDEQFGKVLRAIGKHYIQNDETATETFTKDEKLLFKMMKYEIDINFEKYEKICEKRREAGKLGAERKNEKRQMLANACNNKNNNKNINNNNINNKNNNNGNCDFGEIEQLALERRIKNSGLTIKNLID